MYYEPQPKCPFRTECPDISRTNQQFRHCDWDNCDFCKEEAVNNRILYYCEHPIQLIASGRRTLGYSSKE